MGEDLRWEGFVVCGTGVFRVCESRDDGAGELLYDCTIPVCNTLATKPNRTSNHSFRLIDTDISLFIVDIFSGSVCLLFTSRSCT